MLDQQVCREAGPQSGLTGCPSGSFERQEVASDNLLARALARSLDHVGRGVMLVGSAGKLLFANRLARAALKPQYPLQIEGACLRGRRGADDAQLTAAIDAALQRGLRRMVTLGRRRSCSAGEIPGETVNLTVSVVPVDGFDGGRAVMVSLPQPCRTFDLAIQVFSLQQGFTIAERAVLEALLAGQTPSAIARAKGVALSTVRTQIGQLRNKSGTHSIQELVDRIWALPPMMGLMQ
jgi:DNA-binding CsgD family transcriptional regulator